MNIKEEIVFIDTLSDYELVLYMQNGLLAKATGNDFDNILYQNIRTRLIQNKSIQSNLPEWIKTCRDIKQFWSFIQTKFAHYQERREFIWGEFSPLLNQLELKTISPIEEIVKFDEAHIHELWQKAIDRKDSDPEGAITMARTLIESLLKHILEEQNIKYDENSELSELYKEVAKTLNLAPEQHQAQIFKQILGGANGIISGLGSMRNKLGDAHGTTKSRVKPKERHGELAVNLAGSMALFIYKTFKVKSQRS